MSWGHLHLMLNHLPVLGVPALLALLAWGLARGLPEVTRIALWCTVALGAVTGVVYLTGEAAEEMVELLPAFQDDLAEGHEEVALVGLLAGTVSVAATAWTGDARSVIRSFARPASPSPDSGPSVLLAGVTISCTLVTPRKMS